MRSVQAAFYAALVLAAGVTAAVVAHVTLDVAGDFLLAHDSYDGVVHHSRALLAGVAVAVAAVVALRFVWEALDRDSHSLVTLLRRIRAARGVSNWRFIALVAIVAVAGLVAMEFVDCVLASAPIGGVADLLGGSLPLGLGTTAIFGLAIGGALRVLLRLLADWEPNIAALVERLLPRQALSPSSAFERRARRNLALDGACRLARRAGKRAPPLPTPA